MIEEHNRLRAEWEARHGVAKGLADGWRGRKGGGGAEEEGGAEHMYLAGGTRAWAGVRSRLEHSAATPESAGWRPGATER